MLRHTIERISGLSAEARTIADRLTSLSDASEIDALKAKVKDLESAVAILKSQQDSTEKSNQESMNDDEVESFKQRFSAAIQPTRTVILQTVYNEAYFKGLPESIRSTAAQVVASELESRQLDVPAFLRTV